MSIAQDMLDAANSKVRNALVVRRDNPEVAFRMLVSAADVYEQLELVNLCQNALEYAWEVQCDFLGGPDEQKFAELMRECRLRSYAKHFVGIES